MFYLKHNFLETGLCLRLQVEPWQVGSIDNVSLCLRIGFHLETETEFSLQKVVF
jgi:hypothetical protein